MENKGLEQKEKPELAVLPYVKSGCQRQHPVLEKHFITNAFKAANTIGQHLFRLKDKKDISKSVDAIYKIGYKNYPKHYYM